MKYLLVGINAKYIHSNLGIYSLKRYCEEKIERGDVFLSEAFEATGVEIELGEYTINHQMERILQDIYRKRPDVVGFSCYIWNIVYVRELVRNLKKIRPEVRIWLGGPEVSWDAESVLRMLPEAEVVMLGEGEDTFYRLVEAYSCISEDDVYSEKQGEWKKRLFRIPGIAFRDEEGNMRTNGPAPLLNMDDIPFPYLGLEGMEHRIIYYESSRGCPFSCSYCLSSLDRKVRFRNLDLVFKELSFFLENRVPQVKFVDRTFNCQRDRAEKIWEFILENDNGVTNFHFEISADLLTENALSVMGRMRPGLIQLEIGVQTTNPDTIREIKRQMDLDRLGAIVKRIGAMNNIHQHLDLIAGLPWEGPESFRHSYNEVYNLKPSQLQLGFLKVLKGSYMAERTEAYGLLFQNTPPYEVLKTRWMDYGDLVRLKGVEEMTEVYYNSGQYMNTLGELVREFADPFGLYSALAEYYEKKELDGINHSRLARYEILYQFICEETDGDEELYRDLLMCDLYLRENVKSRPSFAREPSLFRDVSRCFFEKEAAAHRYLKGYEGFDSRQLAKMAHLERMGDGSYRLFDYRNREALFGNAGMFCLTPEEIWEYAGDRNKISENGTNSR